MAYRSSSRLVFFGLVILAGIFFICGLDVDHIAKYLLGLEVPGRLWHSSSVFSGLALVAAFIFVALVVRRTYLNL